MSINGQQRDQAFEMQRMRADEEQDDPTPAITEERGESIIM